MRAVADEGLVTRWFRTSSKMSVSICIFLFTFMVFLNSVAPTGLRVYDEGNRPYTLDLNNRVVTRPRAVPVAGLINLTLYDEDMNIYKVDEDRIAVLQDPPAGTPTPDIIKELLNTIPGGKEFCIHMKDSDHFMVGKLNNIENVPNWIMQKPKAPFSAESIYVWNPECPYGPHSGAVGFNILGEGGVKCISENYVRAYVKIDDENFFTAELRVQAGTRTAPPIWPIHKNIHQFYVRHPNRHRIFGGALIYLLRNEVPPVIVEKMALIRDE